MVQDEVEKALAPVSVKPIETQRRPIYAAVTRSLRVPAQRLPTQPRKTYLWRTVAKRPICFHCGCPGLAIAGIGEPFLTVIEIVDKASMRLELKMELADLTLFLSFDT
ncbi:hypothetical protein TNIN_486631 [Trichonephila inaurata madagascariensis]|uniref:Uncharacterized protein n=1 Tax=Trichonephila inaurata madagascariensis TaxID=2747483 RepID=A0A8X7CD53_9ARAC|nr:hypothetical protein TNIN_486631 [Trichonephila inaurata madagascariensis]